MSKTTFEQAMRISLGNLNLTKIIEEEFPVEFWTAAFKADQKQIDDFVDGFCMDMEFLAERPIGKKSYLDQTYINWVSHISRNHKEVLLIMAKKYYEKTLSAIDHYINRIIDGMQCDASPDITVKPFPFSKIRRDKKVIFAYFPSSMDLPVRINLKEPITREINEVQNKPKHIQILLDKLQETHYDYKPYILEEEFGDKKFLVIRLGNDWQDIAIAQWVEPSKKNINTILMLVCMMASLFGASGFYYNGFNTEFASNIIFLVLNILCFVISAFLAGIFVIRNNKPFNV